MRKLRWGICQYREGIIGVEGKKEKDGSGVAPEAKDLVRGA